MRLSNNEKQALTKAITPYINTKNSELRLYGSRTDDTKRGGDIDLLLIASKTEQAKHLMANKHKIFVSMKLEIGEQKIDLTIIENNQLTTNAFVKTIYPESILLHRWE
jgi:predicted nucleotidyltransferase